MSLGKIGAIQGSIRGEGGLSTFVKNHSNFGKNRRETPKNAPATPAVEARGRGHQPRVFFLGGVSDFPRQFPTFEEWW